VRFVRVTLCLTIIGLCAACANVPPQQTSASRRVSPDYTATGTLQEARAYVYGNVTLLEFGSSSPFSVTIRDANGTSLAYEKIGRHYRLARIVDDFTVWANGQSVTFNAPKVTRIFSAPQPTDVTIQPIRPTARFETEISEPAAPTTAPEDASIIELLKLARDQLAQARRLFDEGSKNPSVTGRELFDVNQHLDKIKTNMMTAATATIRVSFPTGGSTFRPDSKISSILAASGKAAERIVIRGRTDSRIAGPADPAIALDRAMAARAFLIRHGVSPHRIRVFSKADGNFSVPNVTPEGRSINRRVEIEVTNPRIAALIDQDHTQFSTARPSSR